MTTAVTSHTAMTSSSDRVANAPFLASSVDGEPTSIVSRLGFTLLLVATGLNFVRPFELFPQLATFPLYNALLFAAAALSATEIARRFTARSLRANPVTICVVGLVFTAVLSHLAHRRLDDALHSGFSRFKLLLYYLLVVTLVNTPRRMRSFLLWLSAFVCIQVGVALLQHYHVIDLAALHAVGEQQYALAHGEVLTQFRICGAGIFNDPNDLGVLAAVAVVLCLHHLTDNTVRQGTGRIVYRLIWLAAFALCGRTLMLTQSRGAFISLLAALAVFIFFRFGWKRAAIVGAVGLPLLLVLFAGRQSNINVHRTTAQQRLGFWSKGLSLVAEAPLTGVGEGKFASRAGGVAHNSFLHSFAETGIPGGTLFLGAFALAGVSVFLSKDAKDDNLGPTPFRACVLGMLAAWVGGMLTLSRSHVPPTYLMLGLATAYLNFPAFDPKLRRPQWSFRLMGVMLVLSGAFLGGLFLFVRCFHRA